MRLDKTLYDKNLQKEIKTRVAGKIDVQLGKNGITRGFINEIKNRLDKHGVVKVRVLKSFRKTNEVSIEHIAEYLAEQTMSRVYEIRGFTMILVKEQTS